MNDGTTPLWKRLSFYFGTQAYGERLSHVAIADILGAQYGSREYYTNVKSAIADQQRRKRHWRLVPSIGYQLLFPHEIHVLAADNVGRAKSSVLRGSVALQHRDSQRIPSVVDRSYASAESALSVVTDLLEKIEVETRVSGKSDRFDELKRIVGLAMKEYRNAKSGLFNGGAGGGRSKTRWQPFRCQKCNKLLLKHVGVVTTPRAGVEVVCKCGHPNFLFGVTDSTSFDVAIGEIEKMVDS